jgi:hypothetical protein
MPLARSLVNRSDQNIGAESRYDGNSRKPKSSRPGVHLLNLLLFFIIVTVLSSSLFRFKQLGMGLQLIAQGFSVCGHEVIWADVLGSTGR